MSKQEIFIAQLSNALSAFQKTESISEIEMIAILEECVMEAKRTSKNSKKLSTRR